jgi:glycosyltransferase involved in cell wall biosynthesis
MKILIAIATYRRIEKLQRCLDSIARANRTFVQCDVVVVADNNDFETAAYLNRSNHCTLLNYVQTEHKFVIGAWNWAVNAHVIPGGYDGFIGLCDDVEVTPHAIEAAVIAMKQNYPNTDGVIGFRQECPGHPEYTFKWFGQTLMGRAFIERYKDVDYQICCPFYKHFYQDEEMYKFAHSMGRFHNEVDALLYHYHPSFVRNEIDDTHNIIRSGPTSPKNHDIALYKRRLIEGKIWGETWKE